MEFCGLREFREFLGSWRLVRTVPFPTPDMFTKSFRYLKSYKAAFVGGGKTPVSISRIHTAYFWSGFVH